ncbi:hypothetical protein G6F36_012055 [Rhizopus arrhizus]|nr:hypothetical protein G6F36_012055 [Rhizopus arrhizus]
MYGFIKATKHISKTTTETGCSSSASNYNKNMRRVLGLIDRIERQVAADHSDLTFKHLSSELGCAEIGLVDHGSNEQYKIKANKIKIVSAIISVEIMTFGHGSVGLLYTSPRLKMPESIGEVPRLLPPALSLIYNYAQVIKNTSQFLGKNTAEVNLNPFSNIDYFFPPSFVPGTSNSPKKRKASSSQTVSALFYPCFIFPLMHLTLIGRLEKLKRTFAVKYRCTSADFETVKAIQKSISTKLSGSTFLCIAPRLQTVIEYDRILAFCKGSIVEFDRQGPLDTDQNQ